MKPSDLTHDDHISIDTDGLSGATFRVSDVDVTNIGITETVAVTLVCGCDRYSIVGTTADSQFTLKHLDGDEEWDIFAHDIELDE